MQNNTKFNSVHLNSKQISELREIVGADYVLTDEANLLKYGNDETEDFVFPPSVVVKPKTVSSSL